MLVMLQEFFNNIQLFFDVGLPDLINEALVYLGKLWVYGALKAKLFFISLSIDIAQSIMVDLSIGAQIESSFNALDSKAIQVANFFRIPDFIQIVFTGAMTRFVLSVF